jgi:hypothetical protein
MHLDRGAVLPSDLQAAELDSTLALLLAPLLPQLSLVGCAA